MQTGEAATEPAVPAELLAAQGMRRRGSIGSSRNDDRYIEAIHHNCGNLPLPET